MHDPGYCCTVKDVIETTGKIWVRLIGYIITYQCLVLDFDYYTRAV